MNRQSVQSFDAVSNKNKRRRIMKNEHVNEVHHSVQPSPVAFNDFLGVNDVQKPRSHANARERDRTHRCPINSLNRH